MDDVKDKVKGFMKKVNNPFSSSSSGKFKGQGRVLGSSSSSGPPTNPYKNVEPKRNPPSVSPSNPKPKSPIDSIPNSNHQSLNPQNNPNSRQTPSSGFDPFDSLVTSSKRSQNGHSLDVFECPVCGNSYLSEEEVSAHIDSCLGKTTEDNAETEKLELIDERTNLETRNELASCVGAFVSGEPPEGSVEVVLKLLGNIVKEPENVKFRRIRMGNPKIREAIGSVAGGVELLECVGFRLQEEGEEMWAVMEVPSEEQIFSIKEVISLLEPRKVEDLPSKVPNGEDVLPVEPKKIDRQVRVFFSVSESIAAKIELPDTFFNLSVGELKREADMRKKKIAESQLLIPKSYKERQAKAARKKYKTTVIRIQFPDEVVLQGVFLPWEPTTALYEV
ncbi:PUG domain [Macleaya cordata]|uniref:PUG domain n=1 Tax=Macleaya cordata TaxID=56857 RepID=A0A200QL14_MACCD|nr:PUG domain [Macleaya cordata]